MTFANIQEIRVQAGPLQKFLGLADVEVHAAGGGAAGKHGEQRSHKALFEGVDNANVIRDLLVERLRQYRESGLGEKTTRPIEPASSLLTALTEVREEARMLRSAFLSPN